MQMSPEEQFKLYTVKAGKVGLVPFQSTPLAGQNPRRIGIAFDLNNRTATVHMVPNGGASPGSGITLDSVTPYREYRHTEWGALVGMEWNGVTDVGGVEVYVVELILEHWPCPEKDTCQE